MTDTLTIATWNLRQPSSTNNARSKALLEKIYAVNADIWILTETHTQIALDGYSCLATPQTPLRRQGERAVMIWSRWPMEEVSVLTNLPPVENPPRISATYAVTSRATAPAVCGRVAVPGMPVLVYGTIITYYADGGPTGTSALNTEQQYAITTQGQDWRRLRAEYPSLPLVVAGDFDATCDSRNEPTIQTCRMLRAALAEADLSCVTERLYIDHICMSSPVIDRVINVGSWQQQYWDERGNGPKPASDHDGVHVTLTVVD